MAPRTVELAGNSSLFRAPERKVAARPGGRYTGTMARASTFREVSGRRGVVPNVLMRLLTALLLVTALLPGAAVAQNQTKKPAEPTTHERLRTQCLLHAADPKNPWALAHGITGLGGKFAAEDGRRAADVIVSDFLQKSESEKQPPWAFPRVSKDGTPVEPHPNLLTRTLVFAGLPDKETFQTPHGKVTLGDLVTSVQLGYAHAASEERYWVEVGWTLDLLAHRLSPKNATFKNVVGQELDFNRVMDNALEYLERSQAHIASGMDQGHPYVAKNKQGIYAHACGGLHLVQAVAHWARHPSVKKKWGKRWDRQVDILFYRLSSEQQQYESVLASHPEHKLAILVQMMKFYGHFLETTGRMKTDKVATFDKARMRDVRKAQALLDATVRELSALGVFDRMADVQKAQKQLHLDLIGDACHAANGLSYWK